MSSLLQNPRTGRTPKEGDALDWQAPGTSRPPRVEPRQYSTCCWQPYIPPRTLPYCPPWRWIHDYEKRRVLMDPPPAKKEAVTSAQSQTQATQHHPGDSYREEEEDVDEVHLFSATEFCHLVTQHLQTAEEKKRHRAKALRLEHQGEVYPGRTKLLEKIKARQFNDPLFEGFGAYIKGQADLYPHGRYLDYLRGDMDPDWLSWHPKFAQEHEKRTNGRRRPKKDTEHKGG